MSKFDGRFRLSKFEVNSWFDGEPHIVRRGVDFPEEMANEDIVHRLRCAAVYRKCRVVITPVPAGLLVHAGSIPESPEVERLAVQLGEALDRNDDLEEVLREVSRAVEEQVRQLTTRLNALEVELLIQKEELSTLKTRQ